MRRWREPPHALPLAALAAAVTLVLIAAGGRGATRPGDASASSWKGLAGEQRPHVAVGQRMAVRIIHGDVDHDEFNIDLQGFLRSVKHTAGCEEKIALLSLVTMKFNAWPASSACPGEIAVAQLLTVCAPESSLVV